MNKEEAIKYFIDTLYKNDAKVLYSKKEIDEITKFYKKNHKIKDEKIKFEDIDKEKVVELYKKYIKMENDLNSFLDENKNVKSMLKKSKSAMCEIKKQFRNQKALQAGIISECYYASTLAKIFGLDKFLDLETCLFNEVPPECINYINSNTLTFNCARYLYYNKKDLSVFIIQYGNPAEGDAEIIINGVKIRLEFKEEKAKAGEYDIKCDEDGKLIISDDFAKKLPELSKMIIEFNNKTSIFEKEGHNYKEFDEQLKIGHVKRYFENNNIDILISTNKNKDMLAVTSDCLRYDLKNKIISTDESEIRTAGRNPSKKIFTPNYLEKTMKRIGAIKIDDNTYKVVKKKHSLKKARGKDEISRFELSPLFFVKVSDLIVDGEYYVIKKDKIQEKIPTVSVHIKVVASADELKEFYSVE